MIYLFDSVMLDRLRWIKLSAFLIRDFNAFVDKVSSRIKLHEIFRFLN